MKFKYFSKSSKTKEPIQIIEAESLKEAYIIASKIKQMRLEDFKKIFEVESYER